jgi:molecular chaperone DnaK (HSP70)
MAPAVGIDLGTTYSAIAAFYNGKIKIIPNEQGNNTTPSYVGFKDDKRMVGDAAKNQVKNGVFTAKFFLQFLNYIKSTGRNECRKYYLRFKTLNWSEI